MPFNIDKYAPEKEEKNNNINNKPDFSKFSFQNIKIPKLNNNITILLVVLICAFSYIYVEHSKIAYEEKIRNEKEIEEINQRSQLDACLFDAEKSYAENWDRQCKSIGRKKDCQLPVYRADPVEKWRTEAKQQCMEKFKSSAFSD